MGNELRGWKDIGNHFGTSERTVQRWEREHGMPVHRSGPKRGASVFALTDELDAWRMSIAGARAFTNGRDDEAEAEDQASAGVPTDHSGADAVAATPALGSRRRLLTPAIAAALVLVAIIAWVTIPNGRAGTARRPVPLPEAYTVPTSPAVFVVEARLAEGEIYRFYSLDGGLVTVGQRGGAKFGFAVLRQDGQVQFVVDEIVTDASGLDRVTQLNQGKLEAGSWVHVERAPIAVDFRWVEALPAVNAPKSVLEGTAKCGVVCGDVVASGPQVVGPCGSCCLSSGCLVKK